MMIYYYDVCAFLILIMLFCAVIVRKNSERQSNAILLYLLGTSIIVTAADIVGALSQNSGITTEAARTVTALANYVYFALHNMQFPLFVLYIYASLDLWYVFRARVMGWLWWISVYLVVILILVANIFTGCAFTISENNEYLRGPLLPIFYLSALFYACWGIGLIYKYRSLIERKKRFVWIIVAPIMIVAILLQNVLDNYLLACFGFAMTLLIYIVVVHSNEIAIDPATGATRYHRALSRVRNAYAINKPFGMILIKVVNSNNIRLYIGHDRYSEYLKMQSTDIWAIVKQYEYEADNYYLENGEYGLYTDCTDKKILLEMAEKLKAYYDKIQFVDSLEVIPEACICVVRCPKDVADFDSLVTLATSFDETLGVKKGIIDFADHKNNKSIKIRNELTSIVRKALDEKRLEMYYQPIYSTEEKRFVSAEALIRLRDDKYGYIAPSFFIPAAETSGLIHEIGDFVLEDVIRFISENNLEEIGLKYIQVNLSASQCIEVDLVDKIMGLLDKYNVEPEKISMELTETAADINPQIVDQNVKRLYEKGIRFALDDFGTGYSNIKRVTSLPFAQVKLDKSFVDDIENPVMWGVIQDTISMFKEMGKEILVEGIEQEEVARKFEEIKIDLLQGCDLLQGFYFCRPMPEVEFVEYIKASRKHD